METSPLIHTQLPSQSEDPRKFGMKLKPSVQYLPTFLLIFLVLKKETSDVLICSIKCQNEYYLQPLSPQWICTMSLKEKWSFSTWMETKHFWKSFFSLFDLLWKDVFNNNIVNDLIFYYYWLLVSLESPADTGVINMSSRVFSHFLSFSVLCPCAFAQIWASWLPRWLCSRWAPRVRSSPPLLSGEATS